MNPTSQILSAFVACLGEGLTYDAIKSVVCGVDIEDVNDVTYDYVDGAITGFLGSVGVQNKHLEDMVGGNDAYSIATLDTIETLLDSDNNTSLDSLIGKFSDTYEFEHEVTFDGVSPPKCKSGFKRKLVVKNGKPTWKCMRLFGKAILSAKQKMAIRKAQKKAHSSRANMTRKKSNKVRKTRGL